MELINYLDFSKEKSYLKKIPNDVLRIIYEYIDINLLPVIDYIKKLNGKLTNEEKYNYFHKVYANKQYGLYDNAYIYNIQFNYYVIESILEILPLIPFQYKPIDKLTSNKKGLTNHEKHNLEDIICWGYRNSYGYEFKLIKQSRHRYVYRESVLLAFLFLKYNYKYNGNELIIFATETKRIPINTIIKSKLFYRPECISVKKYEKIINSK